LRRGKRNSKQSIIRKVIITFCVLVFLGCIGMAYELYSRIYQPNIILPSDTEKQYIYIPTGADFYTVVRVLSQNGLLIDSNSFEWLAKQKQYINNIRPGRYKIDRMLNNNELINLLRLKQDLVSVTFNNLRTKEDLVGKIAKQIEADSLSLLEHITDTVFLNKLHLTLDNVVCLFIPNTYEFYWNTSAKEFTNRMISEYANFWNDSRKRKADDLALNFYEVSILASIVEKEQNIKIDERPDIAGVYLNRIKKNMKLESDPTLIFSIGDFSINRVLNKDKKVDSPFNTYIYKGLPPGPICIPSINAIDAVLNATTHDYIFMCAKDDFSGYHNFAKSYSKHLRNARKYQKALNRRRIMR